MRHDARSTDRPRQGQSSRLRAVLPSPARYGVRSPRRSPRRAILEQPPTAKRPSAQFSIGVQAVSKHVQVLERVELIERVDAQHRPARLQASLRDVVEWLETYSRFEPEDRVFWLRPSFLRASTRCDLTRCRRRVAALWFLPTALPLNDASSSITFREPRPESGRRRRRHGRSSRTGTFRLARVRAA